MSVAESEATEFAPAAEEGVAEAVAAGLLSDTMQAALKLAQDRLLDRSLRNKLINTPLKSTKARQVRIFDELSDQVFARLRGNGAFTFTPGRGATAETDEETGATWVPEESGSSERHKDSKLQTQLAPEGLQKRLLSLYHEGKTLEEEQGINVLFVALGFLEWREAANSEIERFAPLVLLPVELIRDGARDRFKLQVRDEDLIANISLQAWLKDEFGLQLPDVPETDDWTPSSYFQAVAAAIEGRDGWRVHDNEMLLGFYSFSKFLLWRDLKPESWSENALLGNGLLKQLLLRDYEGDELVDTPILGDDERIDETFRPMELVHVTDADSSQAIAIQEVLAGKNLVIQGPPGTGKSQTITNVIAGAVAAGKTVLFVAEKMAALEVVHERLSKAKLQAMCLELHSRKSSKTSVLDQLRQGAKAAPPPQWAESAFAELEETQSHLRGHSDLMHAEDPSGFSPFRLMGEICLLKGAGTPTPTFALAAAADWPARQVDDVRRRAQLVAERLKTAGTPATHPWRGVRIAAPDVLTRDRIRPLVAACLMRCQFLAQGIEAAQVALRVIDDLSLNSCANWANALDAVAARPAAFDDVIAGGRWRDVLDLITQTASKGIELAALEPVVLTAFRASAAQEDWTATRVALAGHGGSLLRFLSGEYREAVARLRGHWNGELPKAHRERLAKLDALVDTQRRRAEIAAAEVKLRPVLGQHWNGAASDWAGLAGLAEWLHKLLRLEEVLAITLSNRLIKPRTAAELGRSLRDAATATGSAFDQAATALDLDTQLAFEQGDLRALPSSLLLSAAAQWSETFETLVDWTAARDGLQWLRDLGCPTLADEAYSGEVEPDQLEPILMLAIFEAKWKRLRDQQPDLEAVLGDELNRVVARFRKADVDRIRLASDQVARAHLDKRPSGTVGAMGILADELRKARNLMPVRKLILKAGEAVQRIKPVFMMSPLSVAQYLQPEAVEFDLLVIDEASQVRPEDALGAIARSKQLVVVGDDRQLPPTSFFNRTVNDDGPGDEDDDEAEDGPRKAKIKDVESILNLCAPRFPSRMLKWHYRSEHPALIATSNRAFYRGELMLPPSVVANTTDGDTGLIFRPVPEGGYERGKTARNEIEAAMIAQAALKHALTCPELSLGIGAFSVAQRDCIRDQIDNLARKHPELEALMKPQGERKELFIKNLENIQGDERDVIFISVGYGRDANGKLTQNFGPIGRDGGDRRLNVLITRARKRCEVFSSITAEDIRLDGAGKPGVRTLKEFLKLAKDGYAAVAMETERGFDSPFEESVAHAVRELGYEVRPQVGMAGFFIDLAVIDPRDEGRYLLGIECDGAAYHSSRYARDRDRLRQMILEKRGWTLHRIWSTDWFYKPEREVQKLKSAIEAALSNAAPVRPPEAEPPVPELEPEFVFDAEDEGGFTPMPHRLAPYQIANFRLWSTSVKPQEVSVSQVADWVKQIVEVEQPIHTDEVGRRLAAICGWKRAGSQIQEAARRGLLFAEKANHVVSEDEFWCISRAQIAGRDRSQLAPSDTLRKPGMIAPLEIEAVGLHALQENLAMHEEEIIMEAARLLGFARTGPDVRAAIESALQSRLFPRLQRDHLGG